MNFIFTDLFKQECQAKFRVGKKHVRNAVANPDAQDIVQLDDTILGFFVKRETQPTGETYLLVCTRSKDTNWFVDLAFRILPDLVDIVGTLEPLALLQGLALRFGLTIKIAHQLNKFIFREAIPVKDWSDDPTKLVEVVNPSNHSFVQSMYFKIEQEDTFNVANVALAYCIDTEEYLAWLFGKEPLERKDKEVTVELAPQVRGTITSRDLITPNGTFEFQSDYSQVCGEKTGFLFKLSSRTYHLEVGFTSSNFYIERNYQRLEWLLEPVFRPAGHIHCFAIWSPTQLSLLILDETYGEAISAMTNPKERTEEIRRREKTLKTPPTIPPNSLLTWARQEAIAPVTVYRSARRFYEIVVSSLQSIEDKVLALGLANPFWDVTYDGPKIVSRRPKRERDIHPTIHGLLFDIAIAKNFLITPEYPIAGGQLDFLMSGTLSMGEIVSTCVEFKHAHSDDLLDGLVKQLPAYMKAKGCDFGVYCVMYFRGKYFAKPEKYELHELKFFLEMQKRAAVWTIFGCLSWNSVIKHHQANYRHAHQVD